MILNRMLDLVDADAKVTLRLNEHEDIVSDVPVYSFPSRHDLYDYFGWEVVGIEPIGARKIALYIE